MAHQSSAASVFGIPELCGLIFDCLSRQDIFRLQNLTTASRLHLRHYKPWLSSIFHQAAASSYTVKPVLAETDDDDPKKVKWVYTSGPSASEPVPSIQGEEQTSAPVVRYFGQSAVNSTPPYTSRTTQMQNVKLNWLLQEKFPKWSYYPISNMLGFEEDIPIADYFTNKDASYRLLMLTDPPLSEVTVMDQNGGFYEVANAKGVTMGDVVDTILESLR